MCMCLARVGEAGERGIRGLGLGFTNPVGTKECGCVYVAVVGSR